MMVIIMDISSGQQKEKGVNLEISISARPALSLKDQKCFMLGCLPFICKTLKAVWTLKKGYKELFDLNGLYGRLWHSQRSAVRKPFSFQCGNWMASF